MTTYLSNDTFVEVLDPIPMENIGWEVHAVSPADFSTVVAVFPGWENMTFSKPLSDPGVGTLVVSAADPRLQTDVAGYPLEDSEVLFRVYDEGILRFDWLAEKPSRPEDKPGLLSITGRGTAALFERGIVLPAGYPAGQATTRTFTGARMSAWATLVAEAQARGTIPADVRLDFDGTVDSAGIAWPDLETFDVTAGDNLLDLLNQWTELIGATWVMRPGLVLTVWMTQGNDRRDEVVWHLGGHQQEHVYERDRSSIGTIVYTGRDGSIQSASDGPAMTRWGQRERWISSGDTADAAAISRYATRNLTLLKDQKKVRTVTVPWKAPLRRVFVDWAPGDIVSVETLQDGVQAIKVIAASIRVDANNQTTVEIVISDDPTAALPREVGVAQQAARNGSRATETKASSSVTPASTQEVAAVAANTVGAGTGLTGGGAVGTNPILSMDVEYVQDLVAAMMVAGTGITLTYNDGVGTLTIDSTGGGVPSTRTITGGTGLSGGGDLSANRTITLDVEYVQDMIATFLAAGTGISVTYNDAGNVLTVTNTGVLTTRTVSAGTGLAGGGDLSANRTLSLDLEYVQDQVATMLVAGTGITLTYNDAGGTLTIDSSVGVPTTRLVSTGTGLTGGGDLSANRTLALDLEYVQDQVAAMLVAGAGVTLTYNDPAGTLTVAATSDRETFGSPGTLVTAVGKSRLYFDRAVTIDSVVIGVNTAPTGSSILVDVNKNGTTIFTTQANRPAIAASGFTSGAVTNMDVTTASAGDYLTVDIDQIGSTIAGADLTVTVRYH